MKFKSISKILAVLTVFLISAPFVSAQECYGDGDVNNDGISLSVADMVALARGITNCGYTIPAPWGADLDGNCIIDSADFAIYYCFYKTGISCLPPGFPLLTCCDPQIDIAFIWGDANGNHTINILDVTAILSYLYRSVPRPDPDFTGDANGDGSFGILDATYLIAYLFKSGPAPQCSSQFFD